MASDAAPPRLGRLYLPYHWEVIESLATRGSYLATLPRSLRQQLVEKMAASACKGTIIVATPQPKSPEHWSQMEALAKDASSGTFYMVLIHPPSDMATLIEVVALYYERLLKANPLLDIAVIPASREDPQLSFLSDSHFRAQILHAPANLVHSLCASVNAARTQQLQAFALPSPAAVSVPSLTTESHIPSYDHVVLGGTFDHLHAGHKLLLFIAVMICRKRLVIGLTVTEMLLKKKFAEQLESYEVRYYKLLHLLRTFNPHLDYEIHPLRDAFGPSTADPLLQAIVVSQETSGGGDMVNQKREEAGMTKLDVYISPLVQPPEQFRGEDGKLSSTAIRKFYAEHT